MRSRAAGFTNVTITNVDDAGDDEALAPFAWERQDAEALRYPDGSFDVGIVSAGLHHCRSPHRALLELYRVARVAVVALESRDSALMRLAVRLGAVDEYELGAVAVARAPRRRGREHEHAELRLPLDGAGGREDRRLLRAARPASDPLLPPVRAARGAASRPPGARAARCYGWRGPSSPASRACCRGRRTSSGSRSRSRVCRATCSPGWRPRTSRTSA